MIFNKIRFLVSTCMLVTSLSISSQTSAAQINYSGSISDGSSVTGQVGDRSWIDEIGTEVDFWIFAGVAGQQYDIQASRLDDGLDTTFSLYSGFTIADDSEFTRQSDFGGLSYIDFADDQIPHPGPFGDPFLSFTPTTSGLFTIAIGDYLGDNTGPYNYSLSVSSVNAVPIPAAVWLFGSALVGLAGIRRRRT